MVLFEYEVFESRQLFQLSTNLHSITLNCDETEGTLLECNKVNVYFFHKQHVPENKEQFEKQYSHIKLHINFLKKCYSPLRISQGVKGAHTSNFLWNV